MLVKHQRGYVFANKLEQPVSYNALMSTFGRAIVGLSELDNHLDIAKCLKDNGFYQTDGSRIVLCGTKGELWDVKPEKFIQSYRLTSGNQIDINNLKVGSWIEVSRAAEETASAVGIILPTNYLGVYQTSWATLYVNNPNSSGHGVGDVLVAPMFPNGQPDYTGISPTNNEVFALTYDQGIGGWSKTGYITSPDKIDKLTLAQVRTDFSFKTKKNKYVDSASNEELYEAFVNAVVKATKGVVDNYEGFDEEDTHCWITDMRIGKQFNVYYCDGHVRLIAQTEPYILDESKQQWASNKVSIRDTEKLKSIVAEYNNYAKSISVKFNEYCNKYKLESVLGLAKKATIKGNPIVNQAKFNFTIKYLEYLEQNKIGKIMIDDSMVHDDARDLINEERTTGIKLDVSFNKGYFIFDIGHGYADDDFLFCGWNNNQSPEDPYEVSLDGYDVAVGLMNALDVIIESLSTGEY